MKNKEILCKPNQTIMITNCELNLTQRKIYNVILYKIWHILKLKPNQILFKFPISDLKKLAGIKSTNNTEVKNNLIKLKSIDVEIVKENGDWCIFNLLSQAEKKEDEIEIQLPEKIRQALLDNNFYTTLDLLTLKNLECKYAVILYEIAIRYQKKQIPEFSIAELKQLTGTDKIKSYVNFNNFRNKVITPAILEINEKTDINLSFVEIKRGAKVIAIKFTINTKTNELAIISSQNLPTTKVVNEDAKMIIEEFKSKYNATLNYRLIEKLLLEKDVNYILNEMDKYSDVLKNRNVKNIAGDFYTYITCGYDDPISHKNKTENIPQYANFEQREYSDEYFESLYTNIVK